MSINKSINPNFEVHRRSKSLQLRMSSILPGTTAEAPLEGQLVICTVEQMCFELLMKGSGSDFEWHAIQGFGTACGTPEKRWQFSFSAQLVELCQKNASILSVRGRRRAKKGILAGGVDIP